MLEVVGLRIALRKGVGKLTAKSEVRDLRCPGQPQISIEARTKEILVVLPSRAKQQCFVYLNLQTTELFEPFFPLSILTSLGKSQVTTI